MVWCTRGAARKVCSRPVLGAIAAATLLSTLAASPALARGKNERRPAQSGDLQTRLTQIASTARLGQAQIGISVVDTSTGRTLFELNAAQPLIPASNQKLLTSGAALEVLGKDYIFKTELRVDGQRVIIRGSGDPALGDPVVLGRMQPKMSVEQLISTLAQSLTRAGVTKVGEVIVDDRVFDRQQVHPTWPKDQLDNWYCAQVAGLNFHANVLSFYPSPARGAGSPPVLVIEPEAPWLEIDNRARSTPGGKNAVWLRRDPDTNKFTVSGEVAAPIREAVEVTLNDVPTFMGQLVAAELPKVGVMVGEVPPLPEGRTKLPRADLDTVLKTVRLAQSGEVLDGNVVAVVTTSLKDVIDRCNADSQNLYAEALLKKIGNSVTGEPGSWTNGAAVVRMTISQILGPEAAADTIITDGSGMSRDNRVAPRTITAWLTKMAANQTYGPMFIDSLAEPGEGTLRRRFHDNKLASEVRAKSGRLNTVRCLSGYVTAPDGRRIAFSIMLNNLQRGETELFGRDFTEDVVVAIDQWLAGSRPRSR